jgi:hypothetical protein
VIDIIKGIHSLCVAGFEVGFFAYINKHIHFNMLHEDVTGSELRVSVTVCFHDGDPKYHFRLLSHTDCLYEGEVCSGEDMSSVVNEINYYVVRLKIDWLEKKNYDGKEVNTVPLNSVKFKGAEDGK